jgi:alkanesulfonate monooxygenase SsuD/methylene tetrahydromethanopterin reductase-like flavin-dependent oxidoreductase (luciferase family)
MSGDVVSYRGRTMSLEGAQMRPLPVQRPTPPIWIGGSGEQRMLPLVGRAADAWHHFGDARSLTRKWEIVARAAETAGRDPACILRAGSLSLSGDLDDVRRDAEAKRDAGMQYLVCGWPSEGRARIEDVVARVMPAVP